jgi:hypothetical protein
VLAAGRPAGRCTGSDRCEFFLFVPSVRPSVRSSENHLNRDKRLTNELCLCARRRHSIKLDDQSMTGTSRILVVIGLTTPTTTTQPLLLSVLMIQPHKVVLPTEALDWRGRCVCMFLMNKTTQTH